MTNESGRYATELMAYAEENGFEEVYRQVLMLFVEGDGNPSAEKAMPLLRAFLENIPLESIQLLLMTFINLSRDKMDLLPTEIISAVPLTDEQFMKLEEKLILMFRKQLDITRTVDPSLIGGVRIIAGDIVFDESIKRKLQDMKQTVYKGVYFEQ